MQTKFRFLLLSVCVMQCCLATAWAGENRAVVAAVQAARAAGVPESELNRMLAAGYRYAVPEKDLAQWIETAGIVAGQGLPATALVDKMEEGLSKKIASGRIGEALGRQAAQLHAAGQLVKAFAGEDKMAPWAITRTADLLAAGLAPEEVRQVLSAAPAVGLDERMEALTFYAVLKQSGLPAEVSQKMVAAGLERRYFKEFPVGLAFTVKTARRQQIADERIAAEAMKVMRGTQTFQQAQRALNLQHSQQPAASQGKGGLPPAASVQGLGARGPAMAKPVVLDPGVPVTVTVTAVVAAVVAVVVVVVAVVVVVVVVVVVAVAAAAAISATCSGTLRQAFQNTKPRMMNAGFDFSMGFPPGRTPHGPIWRSSVRLIKKATTSSTSAEVNFMSPTSRVFIFSSTSGSGQPDPATSRVLWKSTTSLRVGKTPLCP